MSSAVSIQNRILQAPWPSEDLKPVPETRCQRIGRIFWNIISVLIPFILIGRFINGLLNRIVSIAVLPAQVMFNPEEIAQIKYQFQRFWSGEVAPAGEKNFILQSLAAHKSDSDEGAAYALSTANQLRAHFKPEHDEVLTPDGVKIGITCFRHKDADASSPTVIHFNGNGEYSRMVTDYWPMIQSIQQGTPCNYVLFDYPGVGDSEGSFRKDIDLPIAGSSVVYWVQQTLQTSSDKICFDGKSLGGGPALATQALNPELTGAHINRVSYSTVSAATRIIAKKLIHNIFGEGRCATGLAKMLSNWAASQVTKRGFDFNSLDLYNKVKAQAPILIVRHPHDQVIETPASLQEAVNHDQFLELQAKPGYALDSLEANHNAHLEWHVDAAETLGRFVFAPVQVQADAM
ncbi:MAG: hypothetical protein JSS32_06010 [Verrucomicrobia bacterium]|nr:hypothetical protein [Verrucomicrobiota bacterium]